MPASPSPYASYTYHYTRSWLVSSVLLIALRLVGMSQQQRENVMMTYIGISWLLVIGVNIFEGQRLAQYLTTHRPELIKRGRYGFGLTGLDGWRLLSMTEAIEKSQDTIALWLLENYKNVVVFQVLVFLSYPVLFALLVMWQ